MATLAWIRDRKFVSVGFDGKYEAGSLPGDPNGQFELDIASGQTSCYLSTDFMFLQGVSNGEQRTSRAGERVSLASFQS